MAVVDDSPTFEPQWMNPADAEAPWFRDIMHNPFPISPLNATLFQPAFQAGASAAISRLSMPITELKVNMQHGYVYLGSTPAVGTPDELEARFGEMQRLTMVLGATVLNDWRETFEPQVLALAAELLDFPYESSSVAEIAAHLSKSFDWLQQVWDIHMRVNIPAMNSVFGFEEFLGSVLGQESLPEVRNLLQGFDNKSVAMGRALWALSRWVRANGGTDGAEFDREWRAFLDEFGWRSDVFMEFGHPSWREDPSTAMNQLERFVAMDDDGDPYVAHARQASERDALELEIEQRLPPELHPQFRGMLAGAQQYLPIAEDHNFTIDQKFTMVMREGFLHLGRALVSAGAIVEQDDVFYLEWDEVQALADAPAPSDLSDRVTERKAVRESQFLLDPPPMIGAPPPPDAPPDPLVEKFFGMGVVPSEDTGVVVGHGVSAGVTEGIARVVLTLDDAWRLEADEILVCPNTMPAWTPLFGLAGGVVCDSGGPLSHCAIVAREYMIPCVAGTVVGTKAIRDGSRIRVDGGSGRVEILD